MNFGLILLIAIIGTLLGIIAGALWLLIKLILSERRARKDFKNNKVMEIKEINEVKEIKEEEDAKR